MSRLRPICPAALPGQSVQTALQRGKKIATLQCRSVSKKHFRPAVRILKLSKSFKILLIERAVGFLPPAHTPRCSVPDIFCEVF